MWGRVARINIALHWIHVYSYLRETAAKKWCLSFDICGPRQSFSYLSRSVTKNLMWCDFDFVLGLNINPDIDFNIVNVIVVKGVHIM